MKTYFTIIASLMIMLSSCTPEPPVEEPPKAKGIYECFIDGEAFRANGPNFANQWAPNPHASYTELGGSFSFRISNRQQEQGLYLSTNSGIDTVGSYKISFNSYFGDNSKSLCDQYLSYKLLQDKGYYIDITHLDLEYDIIVGSYEVKLSHECMNDTISIVGSFDLEYSL